ncbi:MAG: nitrogenase-stabilizing/protective protein NifW [Cyanobacteria bacterium J06614_10]
MTTLSRNLTKNLTQFHRLKDAEEYFAFFDLDYDSRVLNVNRLHILRKFSQLVQAVDKSLTEQEKLLAYRQALQMAYDLFLTSNSVEQKLFKVFTNQPDNIVLLSDITVES